MDFLSNFFRWGNQDKPQNEEEVSLSKGREKTTKFIRPKPKKIKEVKETQEVVEIDDA